MGVKIPGYRDEPVTMDAPINTRLATNPHCQRGTLNKCTTVGGAVMLSGLMFSNTSKISRAASNSNNTLISPYYPARSGGQVMK